MDNEKQLKFNHNLDRLSQDTMPRVESAKESVLTVKLLQWLLEYYKIEYSPLNFLRQSEKLFPNSPHLGSYINSQIDPLSLSNILSDPFNITEDDLYMDTVGNWFQNYLANTVRKNKAVNYTKNPYEIFTSANIFESMVKNKINSVCDPFCGSGRLITSYLKYCKTNNLPFPKIIAVNDIFPLAVLITISRVTVFLTPSEIDTTTLKATVNDGFSLIGNYDLVIINPPFTRTHRIAPSTRDALDNLVQDLNINIHGQPGLHIYSLFLASTLLNLNGILVAVLPLSTLLSTYTKSLKIHLLRSYQALYWYFFKDKKSHSDGSDIKELILFGSKFTQTPPENPKITFHTVKDSSLVLTSQPPTSELLETWNWNIFFADQKLRDLASAITSKANLQPLDKLPLAIIRGIELYGPNFFFFPNKVYEIQLQAKNAFISPIKDTEDQSYTIPRSFFYKILRQPKLYKSMISPKVEEYCLVVPTSRREEINNYIENNRKFAQVAVNKFGKDWVYHTRDQLEIKEPYGNLFVVDKLDLFSSCSLAFYCTNKIPCTKNFYVIKSEILNDWQIKFLAAWLNSSLFLLLYLLYRREIGGTWGRLQIIDYKSTKLFPDPTTIQKSKVENILDIFDNLRTKRLPGLLLQIGNSTREKLDTELIKFLQLEFSTKVLYNSINDTIKELTSRTT